MQEEPLAETDSTPATVTRAGCDAEAQMTEMLARIADKVSGFMGQFGFRK